MPKKLERRLFGEVNRKHPTWSVKHKDRYVFGTLNKVKKEQAGKRKGARKRR